MYNRVAYTIQAAGYLVRATPDVYGLHLANLGLNEEKVGLLADPLNAISDNNLQVDIDHFYAPCIFAKLLRDKLPKQGKSIMDIVSSL